MDQPPPASPPPPPSPQFPSAPPAQTSRGFPLRGCLFIVAALVILTVSIVLGGWYLYGQAVETYTSATPTEIRIATPTPEELKLARLALVDFRRAINGNTVHQSQFSSQDVNALIATDPAFIGLKGKAYLTVANSEMTLETVLPLDSIPLPKLRGRWINLVLHLVCGYADGDFYFDFKSGTAGGIAIPKSFFRSFNRSFTRSFNDKFKQTLARQSSNNSLWNHIGRISLDEDKLTIATKVP